MGVLIETPMVKKGEELREGEREERIEITEARVPLVLEGVTVGESKLIEDWNAVPSEYQFGGNEDKDLNGFAYEGIIN